MFVEVGGEDEASTKNEGEAWANVNVVDELFAPKLPKVSGWFKKLWICGGCNFPWSLPRSYWYSVKVLKGLFVESTRHWLDWFRSVTKKFRKKRCDFEDSQVWDGVLDQLLHWHQKQGPGSCLTRKHVGWPLTVARKRDTGKKTGFPRRFGFSSVDHLLPECFSQGIWSLADDESIASKLAKADADGEDLSSVDKRQFWDLALAIPELWWKWEAHLPFFLLIDQ